jgi:hypothetical protein
MKINYELERQDLINFYNYYIGNIGTKSRIIKKALMIIYLSSIFSYIIHDLSKLNLSLSIVISFISSCLLTFVIEKNQKENMLKNSTSLGKQQTIEISSEGVNKHNNIKDDFSNWDKIISIAQDENEIYLFTNPKCALILPIRSFDSSEHKDRFVQLVEEYKKNYEKLC